MVKKEYGKKVCVIGPDAVQDKVLRYIADFTEIRLQEIYIHPLMTPVEINLKGDKLLTPDQMIHRINADQHRVELILNSKVLQDLEMPGMSMSVVQGAAAATSTIGITEVLNRNSTQRVTPEELEHIFKLEVSRSARIIDRALKENPDVTGSSLKGSDVYHLD